MTATEPTIAQWRQFAPPQLGRDRLLADAADSRLGWMSTGDTQTLVPAVAMWCTTNRVMPARSELQGA